MKHLKKIIPIVIALFLLGSSNLFSQKGGKGGKGGKAAHHGGKGKGHHHHPGKRVVKRSIYRPAKLIVYHPHWCKKRAYNRRWVYFPKYNFYWDNWRNHYVFMSGAVWVTNPAPPPVVVNINIENEKHYELKDDDDDTDDVYQGNDSHKSEYKPE